MLSLGWKKFSFFEQSPRRDHEVPAAASRCCPGPDAVIVGCTDGSVALLDRNLQIKQTYQAHSKRVDFVAFLSVSERCTACHNPLSFSVSVACLQKETLLLTLGQDDGATGANLKIWNMEGQPKTSTASPPCLKSLKLFTPKQPEGPVTALAVYEESWPQLTAAVGLANGAVYVLRGDVGVRDPQSLKLCCIIKTMQLTSLTVRLRKGQGCQNHAYNAICKCSYHQLKLQR